MSWPYGTHEGVPRYELSEATSSIPCLAKAARHGASHSEIRRRQHCFSDLDLILRLKEQVAGLSFVTSSSGYALAYSWRMADQVESTSGEVSGGAAEFVRRPFRVKLRGSVLVLVRLPNKRDIQAKLHQLSTTGGVIHFEKPLDEKLEVELIFHIRETTIRGKAQMLFPMWATQGWMQPFRFKDLSEESRETLGATLKTFVGEAAQSAAAGQ